MKFTHKLIATAALATLGTSAFAQAGETVKIAYVDQAHSNIDQEKTIWQNFSDEQELVLMGGREVNSRAYLSRFNFSGGEQNKKVKLLSGGERNRLHLAMTLKEEGNVLLLDEPLAAQDVESTNRIIELLKAAAKAGKTIILVAHVPESELSWCDQIIKNF